MACRSRCQNSCMVLSSTAAIGTQTVKHRLSVIDLEAVLLQKMCKKFGRDVTVQVLDLSATHAGFVQMTLAGDVDVLKEVASALGMAAFANRVAVAERGKLSVEAALSALRVSVERHAELLDAELTVGVA